MRQRFQRIAALLSAILFLLPALPALAQQADCLHVLLIGVDTADGSQAGRSDTMILAQVRPDTGQIKLVSFLRDLYVSIPGHGQTRLNAAYYYGGQALLKQTLEKHFGITIDRCATVHFSTLVEGIDRLGGVELELTEAERKHLNKLLKDGGNPNLQLQDSGMQHLNGRQALAYSRIRKIDSDFQRTARQQALLQAMLKAASGKNAFSLTGLALSLLTQVETDLTLGDCKRLLPLVKSLDTLEIETARVPFDGAYTDETINGMMVLMPNLEKNRKKLADFLND